MTNTMIDTSGLGTTSNMRRPASLHHTGWVVADQERNRHFFEDVIGLPLIATFTDESHINAGLKFSHTMFEMGDGNTLAFFQMVGPKSDEYHSEQPNRFNHIALRSDHETQWEIHERMVAEGIEHFLQDHGWCYSLYVTTPDGMNLEIAADTTSVDDVMAKRRVAPHADLKRWLAGELTPNGDPIENLDDAIQHFPPKSGPAGHPPIHARF